MPWQSPQERWWLPRPCCPVDGGAPWHDEQVRFAVSVQLGVALVAPPVKLPWQYVELHVACVALVRS